MLNVRPRPLVVNATGAIQKNNTLVDPKPRTHTKQATTPIHCSMLLATFSHQLPCSSLSSFTSLPSPSVGLNILLNASLPPQLFRSPPLSLLSPSLSLHSTKNHLDPQLFMSVLLLPPFLAVSSMAFTTCFSRFLFFSAILLSPSVSSFSLLLLPRFFRTSHTCSRWLQRFAPQPVLPAPWRPTSTRTSTSLRASCQARSLRAGPRLLPFGGLCQRGVETQAVTPSCPIT